MLLNLDLLQGNRHKLSFLSLCVLNYNRFCCFLSLQVSSSNATTLSQPILQLSGDGQAQVAQVAQGQDLNAGTGQTLQSVQLVNPGTFLIQAQTVTATGQIQWQTFQVTHRECTGCFPFVLMQQSGFRVSPWALFK